MPYIWYSIGALALGLGAIGILLPVIPTVPFLLVAVWAFARSSPELRHKILAHSVYGPPIRAWQERGAIGRIAKIWAITAMSGSLLISAWLALPIWLVLCQAVIFLIVGAYVATRPE